MAALDKTNDPGIYKRETARGDTRYVVTYWVGGKQRQATRRTLREARALKRSREADRDRGELFEASRRSFREYAAEWVESYQGNGRRGLTEQTRAEYRRDLTRYAYPFIADHLGRSLASLTRADIRSWAAWLCDEKEHGKRLADATVRRVMAPVRACLSTAADDGLIRANPADGVKLPRREQITEDDEERRPFTREQLDAFLRVAHPAHNLMFRLIAATGLRWGEAAALQQRDLSIGDPFSPTIKVRRALNKAGEFKPPKSRHGRREVPLPRALADELRKQAAGLDPEGLLFTTQRGTPLSYRNQLTRAFKPAAEEAGAEWAAFHTLRHTFASLHIARGTNIVQLSRMLGHHSPDFTLRVYAHLIPGDKVAALDLEQELSDRPAVAHIGMALGSGTESTPNGVPAIAESELLAALS
jgi:integrase